MPEIASLLIKTRIDLSNVARQLRGIDRLGVSAGRDFATAFNRGFSANPIDMERIEQQLRDLSRVASTSGRDTARSFTGSLDSGIRGASGAINGAVTGVFAGAAAVASTAFVSAFQSAVNAGIGAVTTAITTSAEFQKLGNTLNFVAGGAAEGARQMQFVRQEAERLSLPLQAATEGFTKLSAATRGTALEGEKTQQIFTGVATAGAALSLSSEEVAGAMNAISQMVSKGTVSAEELRGQLGERLPGAFSLFARAIGVSEQQLNKLLEQGMIPAAESLPLFAQQLVKEYGSAIPAAMQTMGAATSRVNNALIDMQLQFGRAIEPAVMAALTGVEGILKNINVDFTQLNSLATDFSNYLRENPQIVTEISTGINDLVSGGLKQGVEFAQTLAKHLSENPDAIREAFGEFKKLLELMTSAASTVTNIFTTLNNIGMKIAEIWQSAASGIEEVTNRLRDAFNVGGTAGTSGSSGQVVFPIAGQTASDNKSGGGGAYGAPRHYGAHDGQDYSYARGTPVLAPFDGRIKSIATDKGEYKLVIEGTLNGQRVEVDLVHLDTKDVELGQSVTAGSRVGTVGGGRGSWGSRGDHLHAGFRVNGVNLSPDEFYRRYGSSSSASSNISGTDIAALTRAIIGKESGGNYSAVNPDSGAIGIGQVMPANVPSWTEKHYGRRLTPEEFRNNREAQDKVVQGEIRDAYNRALRVTDNPEIARRRVAAEWYSGQPGLYNDTRPQGGGKYPPINDYTLDVNRLYQQEVGQPSASTISRSTTAQPTNTANAPAQFVVDARAEQQRKEDEKKRKADQKKIDDANRAREKAEREARNARLLADRNADASKAQQRSDALAAFNLETRQGQQGLEGDALSNFNKQREHLAEINKLLQQREDLVTAQQRKIREGETGGVDFAQAIKNIDTQISATRALNTAEMERITTAQETARISAENYRAFEYNAQRQDFYEGLREKARERAQEQNYRNYDYLMREKRLIEVTNELKYQGIERASAEIQRQEDYRARAVRLGEVLKENWEKAHQLEIQVVEGIGGSFKSAISDLITGTKSFGEVALNLLADIGNKLASIALESIFGSRGGGGLLGGIFNTIMPALTGGGLGGSISSLSNFGSYTDAINLVNIPAFAKGGYVNKPTIGLIGERGGEYILPEDKMRDVAGQGGSNIVVNINVQGDVTKESTPDLMEKLPKMIANAVDARVIQQKRPGGLLYR